MDKEKSLANLLVFFVVTAGLVALVVAGFYINKFGTSLSNRQDEWGQFGDFFGGILNPILSFFALSGLLITIKEQREIAVESEKRHREQTYDTRLFELLSLSNEAASSIKIVQRGSTDAISKVSAPDKIYQGHSAIEYAWRDFLDNQLRRMDCEDLQGLYANLMRRVSFWKQSNWASLGKYYDSMVFILNYTVNEGQKDEQVNFAISAILGQMSPGSRSMLLYILIASVHRHALMVRLDDFGFFDDTHDDPLFMFRRVLFASSQESYRVLTAQPK